MCPNGNLIVGGDGVLALYDLKGKQLSRQKSPHLTATGEDPAELKRRAKETIDQQRESIQSLIKSMEEQKAELAKRDDAALNDDRAPNETASRSDSGRLPANGWPTVETANRPRN